MSDPALAESLDWLDRSTDEESLPETAALGGALSEPGRREAIAATLPLLGKYFASGSQPLRIAPAVEASSDAQGLTELFWGIRIRVALAAASRLRGILSRIVDRPTFRYQLTSTTSVGTLTGQIDVNRYITKTGPVAEIPVYPVTEVKRVQGTPENVLAVYAALWILRELKEAITGFDPPADGPERGEYAILRRAIEQMIVLPGLAGCMSSALQVSRGRSERDLLRQVSVRLRRREVANASPYKELESWVLRSLNGIPAAEPGEIEWSFYGDRFDTKLFELWCLYQIVQEISRQLVVDVPPLATNWRAGSAAYTWDRPAGSLHLHFQQALQTVSAQCRPRWQRTDKTGRTLGGIPDVVVHAVRRVDQQERFAIIDPKLRQRGGPPTEELYKVLGYFDNFGLSRYPFGAILYHTTRQGGIRGYRYAITGQQGELHAVALNPADAAGARQAIAPIAKMILGLLGISPVADSVDFDAGDADARAEGQVRARLQELETLSHSLPADVLDASRRRVQAMIGDQRWTLLPADVQTMLATSEHVGFSLDATADFSGPVIGLCASIEVLLHDVIIGPSQERSHFLRLTCQTFGQAIYAIQDAIGPQRGNAHLVISDQLHRMHVDKQKLVGLLSGMAEANRRYRIPAAHRELVTDGKWRAAWSALIGPGMLLSNTVDTLRVNPSTIR